MRARAGILGNGMPICPECSAEYREGTPRCADCGTGLSDAKSSKRSSREGLRIVVWTDSIAAGLVASTLEEQGIAVHLEPVSFGLTAAPQGLVRVRVPASCVRAAITVLEYLRAKHPRMLLDYTGYNEFPPIAPGMM